MTINPITAGATAVAVFLGGWFAKGYKNKLDAKKAEKAEAKKAETKEKDAGAEKAA